VSYTRCKHHQSGVKTDYTRLGKTISGAAGQNSDFNQWINSRGEVMHKYEIIIYWSNDDQAFISEAPELPGCAAHGNSPDEALKNCDLCGWG
jgi:hypothetical protein